RQGAGAWRGYWNDAFDYLALSRRLLKPLGPTGSRRYVAKVHDVVSDLPVNSLPATAGRRAIALIDGVFLQREEIREGFDWVVFVDASAVERYRRLADRDSTHTDPMHPSNQRYVLAHRYYDELVAPRDEADVVVVNDDLERPTIV